MFFSSDQTPPDWTSVEAKELRDFLDSHVGKLTVSWLVHLGPSLLDGADNGKTLVASGVVKGYGAALDSLFSLRVSRLVPDTSSSEAYPDLDSPTAWKEVDGKRPPG